MDEQLSQLPELPKNQEQIFIGNTSATQPFHISKNIVILLLSGIFIALVIANLVIFLLPRSTKIYKQSFTTISPTTLPSKSFATSPTITITSLKPSATPTQKPTITPSKTPILPTNTPTITPTPRPPVNNDTTYGKLEQATCQTFSGWAYDPAKNDESFGIWLYADGPLYGGIFSGFSMTEDARQDVNDKLHITGTHGFHLPVISPLKDGKEHSVIAYIEGKDGTRHQLGNTPQYLTCTP